MVHLSISCVYTGFSLAQPPLFILYFNIPRDPYDEWRWSFSLGFGSLVLKKEKQGSLRQAKPKEKERPALIIRCVPKICPFKIKDRRDKRLLTTQETPSGGMTEGSDGVVLLITVPPCVFNRDIS